MNVIDLNSYYIPPISTLYNSIQFSQQLLKATWVDAQLATGIRAVLIGLKVRNPKKQWTGTPRTPGLFSAKHEVLKTCLKGIYCSFCQHLMEKKLVNSYTLVKFTYAQPRISRGKMVSIDYPYINHIRRLSIEYP